MKAPAFTIDEVAKRGKYLVFADISEQTGSWSVASAIWEPQGYRTDSAAKDFNFDREDVIDILDIAHSDIKKGTQTITFEPNPIRPSLRYGRFTEIIHDQAWREETGKLGNHKLMEVATYLSTKSGETTSYQAKVYSKCSVMPTSVGGDGGGDLGMAYEAAFAGTVTYGTVQAALPPDGVELTASMVVFTPEA